MTVKRMLQRKSKPATKESQFFIRLKKTRFVKMIWQNIYDNLLFNINFNKITGKPNFLQFQKINSCSI